MRPSLRCFGFVYGVSVVDAPPRSRRLTFVVYPKAASSHDRRTGTRRAVSPDIRFQPGRLSFYARLPHAFDDGDAEQVRSGPAELDQLGHGCRRRICGAHGHWVIVELRRVRRRVRPANPFSTLVANAERHQQPVPRSVRYCAVSCCFAPRCPMADFDGADWCRTECTLRMPSPWLAQVSRSCCRRLLLGNLCSGPLRVNHSCQSPPARPAAPSTARAMACAAAASELALPTK